MHNTPDRRPTNTREPSLVVSIQVICAEERGLLLFSVAHNATGICMTIADCDWQVMNAEALEHGLHKETIPSLT
eukprot:m.1205774 g.1205774  ORF g.1205774 m.1205774 type:complete len:74 (+) comp24584_c0_seq3:4753-4974(+)